ncbi:MULTISPECIES: DUF1484 family protein [Pseudomonas]|uniref:DUF1484 family protein n=1 Tax=Pseudomonas quercus TaxID=2722792 RepID=A0ABX0YN70_9PSED|nr:MULTISPECIES: DUF1484 family protein [Pseudomonas]MBF7145028.1 DUF1484 family protein [Pseudomonas sp. LY10J]NJP03619.1 DUF1484 family protein [Pseudomonas quercus]
MMGLSKTHKALVDFVHSLPASACDQFETELLKMSNLINRLEKSRSDLSSAECSLRVILELLDAADTRQFKASDLHCLLVPLYMKISDAFNRFDEA